MTAYLRQGAFGGMTRRDWKIFLLSWLIANGGLPGGLRPTFKGLSAVEWVWNWVK